MIFRPHIQPIQSALVLFVTSCLAVPQRLHISQVAPHALGD
jgi:hypothetical protein